MSFCINIFLSWYEVPVLTLTVNIEVLVFFFILGSKFEEHTEKHIKYIQYLMKIDF